MRTIIIFDTTLRDGEQSPGASLTVESKVRIARQLERLGVDVIEAGFPVSSPGDFKAVREVAKTVKTCRVAALARALPQDIEAGLKALEPAVNPRLHIFLATSEIHRKYKLGKAKAEIIRLAVSAVSSARKNISDIEFSPEDATRTEPDFLLEVANAVAEAGATTLNVPDTVGYTVPEEFGKLIAFLRERLDKKIRISIHCHNDLGLAVANSLAALTAGADQVEVAVNGIGERAGNASLEEVVVGLHIRQDAWNLKSRIKLPEIYRTSRLVSTLTGLMVQRNKAVVGENAFRHEAGIHQDGVLKDRRTYEIIEPSLIGVPESVLVLGKHSGRHALTVRLAKLGYRIQENEVQRVFERFKELADKKKEVMDSDLVALVEETISPLVETYALDYLSTVAGTNTVPMSTVRLRKGKEISQAISTGDGPVDAACRAIDQLTGLSARLTGYQVTAVTGGKDALGEVNLRITIENKEVPGRAISTDIIEASVKAYLNAVNRYLQNK
ncbi:MAG: 2-isopropylmalate synthase [Candidatus Omnitrophota bacterium]